MPFFVPFKQRSIALFTLSFLLGAMFFPNAAKAESPKRLQIDSTRHGFSRAKMGMYFKKNWDFRNAWIGFKAHRKTKNSETLVLPKKIIHYQRVFQDSFNQWHPEIWSKGQPWGRFHPDNVHQFYGDPQVFVGNGCLHLLNEPIPVPIVLEQQPEQDQIRLKKAQAETNLILPNLVKTEIS